jgi:uncharacterized protein (TIGR00255 family)
MTGFGRSAGNVTARSPACSVSWVWEIRAVNGRGLDLRLRLPPGFDSAEPTLRHMAAATLKRGVVQATLTTTAPATAGPTIRADLLNQLLALATDLAARIPGAPAPRAEALLALPGVLRTNPEADPLPDEATLAAITDGFAEALRALATARREEGARLAAVLTAQVDAIAAATQKARQAAENQTHAQRQRLRDSLRALLDATQAVGEDRLAQELALLATRADVREELDRLDSHVTQARALLTEGDAVGRRLDFLVQEFNREANTLCSKSATTALTEIGLRLKAVIEQFREQVQNIE